jgi:hypothetical protein
MTSVATAERTVQCVVGVTQAAVTVTGIATSVTNAWVTQTFPNRKSHDEFVEGLRQHNVPHEVRGLTVRFHIGRNH